jgi:hypothetical protein
MDALSATQDYIAVIRAIEAGYFVDPRNIRAVNILHFHIHDNPSSKNHGKK